MRSDRSDARVVRLNAEMFPVSETERRLLDLYGVTPIEIEAARPEQIIPHVRDAEAVCVVSAKLPVEVVDSLDACKLISRIGNGTDRIDVAQATERGIIVSNVPDFSTEEMADHVLGMILLLGRQIPRMQKYMMEGRFAQARTESLQLRRLSNLTLGLVGWGDSAIAVTRRALPCGLQVIATRRDLSKPSPEADELGVEMVELDDLLTRADFVSLHLPLSAGTRGLLNRQRLALMKRGAYLINASRGDIVDEQALAEMLHSGHLGGAGLDTFGVIEIFGETEGPPTHPVVTAESVIATPHVSALSVDSSRIVATGSVQNLVCVLNGHMPPPDQIVNRDVVPRSPLKPYDPALLEE
ncbi:MAG: hypothetical protein CME24_02895 [Gemmatimonadetes bacterium]|nr:hypothetical protein [Gemmatimonadota bacterium]